MVSDVTAAPEMCDSTAEQMDTSSDIGTYLIVVPTNGAKSTNITTVDN